MSCTPMARPMPLRYSPLAWQDGTAFAARWLGERPRQSNAGGHPRLSTTCSWSARKTCARACPGEWQDGGERQWQVPVVAADAYWSESHLAERAATSAYNGYTARRLYQRASGPRRCESSFRLRQTNLVESFHGNRPRRSNKSLWVVTWVMKGDTR